ncbi:unnamed protein product [Caenorhabditis angaria]|uniref:Carbohydrate kinase FGGY N-terminal domain-containing protein n=1 Tax=Caenorhabditis angaria TaxID=860376 RepID=A0A9P1MYB0_9PELO|nr:unnamed protein product [Caenorhabditis angaria]
MIIGIDIGTSSAKICLLTEKREILQESHRNYSTHSSSLQDPKLILQVVLELLHDVYTKNHRISEIFTCVKCSSLYNWMFDCPTEFLEILPKWKEAEIYPGFGMVTMAFLKNSEGAGFFENFDKCGTIMDLFLAFLTKTSKNVKISHHNAFSWGYCSSAGKWQPEILQFLPENIELPEIVLDQNQIFGFWNGAKCHVASGDLQASVAALEKVGEGTAYLIIGTSAQLCLLHPISQDSKIPENLAPTIVNLPFSPTHRLLATCAMNGGNAIQKIVEDFIAPGKSSLRETLDLLNSNSSDLLPGNLEISPIFIAERGSKKKLLKIPENIRDFESLQILEAAHFGVVRNIFEMFFEVSENFRRLALVGAAKEPRFIRQIRKLKPEIEIMKLDCEIEVSTPFGATKF